MERKEDARLPECEIHNAGQDNEIDLVRLAVDGKRKFVSKLERRRVAPPPRHNAKVIKILKRCEKDCCYEPRQSIPLFSKHFILGSSCNGILFKSKRLSL